MPPADADLCLLSAVDVAAAIRARKVSPIEVFEAVATRIQALNPQLNAFCTLALDQAREAARGAEDALARNADLGPLHGVPVAVKDDLPVAGLLCTEGSRLYADRRASHDALAVARLRAAGAIVLGKTNLPEFGHKGTTDNLLFGVSRNPWNLQCTPGGSSGGSAAAVAAGLAYLALGTDIAGSVRIPAAYCGIVGHKPSLGRVPRVMPGITINLLDTTWVIGPMARTVQDAALMLRVLAGPDERDPFALPHLGKKDFDFSGELHGLRIAWSPSPTRGPVDPSAARAAEIAVQVLTAQGVQVEEMGARLDPPVNALRALFSAGAAGAFRDDFPQLCGQLSPTFAEFVSQGLTVTLDQCVAAQVAASAFIERMAAVFGRYDLLATPTTAVPAFSTDLAWGPDHVNGQAIDPQLGWFFTWPFNLTGHPAVSVPCGWSQDGMPYGLQLIGRRGADGLVLRAAAAIEAARPGPHRKLPAWTEQAALEMPRGEAG
ncbi:MAG TPA: amidase family protein [Gemmataceae bacterium]|nr:amidase family protein [Gemmataceae bacterium]